MSRTESSAMRSVLQAELPDELQRSVVESALGEFYLLPLHALHVLGRKQPIGRREYAASHRIDQAI